MNRRGRDERVAMTITHALQRYAAMPSWSAVMCHTMLPGSHWAWASWLALGIELTHDQEGGGYELTTSRFDPRCRTPR